MNPTTSSGGLLTGTGG